MDFISGKHISRRTMLKGVGATLGLPLLDAMVPAGRAAAAVSSYRAEERTRLVCIENVHGAAGCTPKANRRVRSFCRNIHGSDLRATIWA